MQHPSQQQTWNFRQQRITRWLGFGLLMFLVTVSGILCYSNVLNSFFLSDDFVLVALLEKLGPFGLWVNQQHGKSLFFRPVLNLISFIDYQIWGTQAWGYHWTNFVFHLFNALWVGIIAHFLLRQPLTAQSLERFIPYLAGFIFLLMPSHSEAVSWISARTDVISTFFALSAFVTYLSYKRSRRAYQLILSLLLFLCGLLSKESIVSFPGLIILYESYGLIARPYQKRIFRPGVMNCLLYLGVLGIYFLLRYWKLGELVGGYGEDIHLSFNLNQMLQNVIIYPMRSLLVAQPNSGFQFWLMIWLGFVVLVFLCGTIGYFHPEISREIPKTQFFLVLAFFTAVLPAINVSVSIWDTQGERYLYFGSAFTAIHCALILVLVAIFLRLQLNSILIASSGVLLLLGLSLYSVNQNWNLAAQISQTLLDSVASLPQKSLLITSLPDNYKGAYIYRTGFIQALSLFSDNPRTDRFEIQFRRQPTGRSFEQVGFETAQVQIVMNHSLDRIDDQVIPQRQTATNYQLQLTNPNATFLAWKKYPLVTEEYTVTTLQPQQYTLQLQSPGRAADLVIYSQGQLVSFSP